MTQYFNNKGMDKAVYWAKHATYAMAAIACFATATRACNSLCVTNGLNVRENDMIVENNNEC